MSVISTNRRLAFGLSVAALLVGAGCGGSGDDRSADAEGPAGTAQTPRPECSTGEDSNGSATDPTGVSAVDRSDCERDAFLQVVEARSLEGLAELPVEEAVAYGRGVCVFAEAVARGQIAPAPSVEELVTSTAASWGVAEGMVREVVDAYGALCPDHAEVFTEGVGR